MTWLLTFFVLTYTVFIVVAITGWLKLPATQSPENYQPTIQISVLIPARNEAASILNLLQDLTAQHYPKNLLEILVIDDNSEDETVALVKNFAQNPGLNIRVLELKNGKEKGKKSAINFGLQEAKGELIVQTDADCRVSPEWIKLLEYTYVAKGAKFISGPVCLTAGNSVFEKMQVVEFASLIASGAASMGLGKPNMCNGANLAYAKSAFYQVNGFAGNEEIASGDDEFLMHKIHKQFPGKVYFLKAAEAIVYTPACQTLNTFIGQRVRWASKWRFYKNAGAQFLALLVFGVNLLLLLTFILALAGKFSVFIFGWTFLLKTAGDILFLGLVLRFLRRPFYLIYTLPLQVVYIPYVVYCALAGLLGKYQWKGRTINNP